MSFTVTFIGAGSIGFTRKLVQDLLGVPDFDDITINLMDISPENLDMIHKLLLRDLAHNGSNATIRATTDRAEALRGARYVINTTRIGGMDAFRDDIEIPLRYGVDQCVGDTLCAGGIMYGQRGIHFILDLCQDIKRHAEPRARLLNYANPMAMLTWAANTFGGVDTIGLCHGVQGGVHLMARALGIPHDEIDYICAGINHQTWYTKVDHHGSDQIPRLLDAMEGDEHCRENEQTRIDMLRRFGLFSTESNGHLSEYLAWYRKRPQEIPRWISTSNWIHGETGGYLRHCSERTVWFHEDFPRWMAEDPKTFSPGHRSEEHGSYIIEGLETGRTYRGHFNRINAGLIPNLPDDCVIEGPGYVDRTGLHMAKLDPLPWGAASVCRQSIDVQRLAVLAAVQGDDQLLRQAMLLDPLTGAVCNPPEVWQMTDDLLIAQAAWIPQYHQAIAAARARQERARVDGTRIPTQEDNRGAARLRQRSVEELKQEADAHAMADDEGAVRGAG